MALILKILFINKLDDIVNIYNNINHSTIIMFPVDVKSNTYIDFGTENNEKDPKFEIGDHVRISKYKNIFAKGYTPTWSKEVFMIKKLKILCHKHMLLVMLTVKKLLERLTKKNCKK